MGKSVKKILSREEVKTLDGVLQHRNDTSERLKSEVQQNEQLLAPDGLFDVTDPDQQKGRVLSRAQFVSKVQKLNKGIVYEQSINYPDKGGFYRVDQNGKRFICGFPHDTLNEFSVRMFQSDLIPHHSLAAEWEQLRRANQQIPGWRAVLKRLIEEGLITEPQAEKEFQISKGRSSRYWQEAFQVN